MAKAVVALVVALVMGMGVAAFLGGRALDDAPSEAVFGTGTASGVAGRTMESTRTPSGAAVSGGPALFVSQVIGIRGCDQPIFVAGGGFAPRTPVRLDRAEDGQAMEAVTSGGGFVAFDGRALFAGGCEPGVRYPLRLVDEADRRELASARFEAPVFGGTIAVEPASGGCGEIVVTVRGMPADQAVHVFVADARRSRTTSRQLSGHRCRPMAMGPRAVHHSGRRGSARQRRFRCSRLRTGRGSPQPR